MSFFVLLMLLYFRGYVSRLSDWALKVSVTVEPNTVYALCVPLLQIIPLLWLLLHILSLNVCNCSAVYVVGHIHHQPSHTHIPISMYRNAADYVLSLALKHIRQKNIQFEAWRQIRNSFLFVCNRLMSVQHTHVTMSLTSFTFQMSPANGDSV